MNKILEAMQAAPYPITDESKDYRKIAANVSTYLRSKGTPVYIHRHEGNVTKKFLEDFIEQANLPITWTNERTIYGVDYKTKEPTIDHRLNLLILDNRVLVCPSDTGEFPDGEKAHDYWIAFVGEDCTPEEKALLIRLTADQLLNQKKPNNSFIGVIQQGRTGPEIGMLTMPSVTFEPENYTADIVEWWEHLNNSIEKDAKFKGKLSILQGPPGCGKTMFLRSMLSHFRENSKCKFIYVPLNMAKGLSDPSIIPTLNQFKSKKVIIIIEDADSLLETRNAGNNALISEFLNVTDGILGAALNLHVVVTANMPRKDLDAAIIRPGRLHSFLEFTELSKEHAARIYLRETGKALVTTKETLSLAEIYALAAEEENGHTTKVLVKTGQYL